jgi:putative transposase
MAQTNIHSLTQTATDENLHHEIQRAVEGGLAELNLKELLSSVLTSIALAERSHYLRQQPHDKGNGSYSRDVCVGSLPLTIGVPRTRRGEFRPHILPAPYARGYSAETQELLLGLLVSSKSMNAVKSALHKMGLSMSSEDLEAVAKEFVEIFDLHNTKPIDSDLIACFVDGKLVDIKEGDRVRSACIYLVVGLTMEGQKRILACHIGYGKESLDEWKKVLRKLVERGLRRLLILIQDDFPGLLSFNKSFFPKTDIQLCTVHLERNVRRHMNKSDGRDFNQKFTAIKFSVDIEVAAKQFEDLIGEYEKNYPTFINEVHKKRDHYLAFLQYPRSLQRTFSTTNPVETVNNQLERLRINSGGLFQSEDNAKLKLGVVISQLEDGCWKKPSGSVRAVLTELHLLFNTHFESEECYL